MELVKPGRLNCRSISTGRLTQVLLAEGVIACGALLLLTASLLKARLVLEATGARQVVTVGVCALEWLMGAWLLSGTWRRLAGRCGAGLYLFFALVSLSKALAGEASCGCMGAATIAPAAMMALDLVLALGLWIAAGRDQRASPTRRYAFAALGLCGFLLPLGQAAASRAAADFEASPPEIDLGRTKPASRVAASFEFINRTGRLVRIARIETSCACLAIDVPQWLAPGKVRGRAIVDLAREADFVGRLRLRARGLDEQQNTVFSIDVTCEAR